MEEAVAAHTTFTRSNAGWSAYFMHEYSFEAAALFNQALWRI